MIPTPGEHGASPGPIQRRAFSRCGIGSRGRTRCGRIGAAEVLGTARPGTAPLTDAGGPGTRASWERGRPARVPRRPYPAPGGVRAAGLPRQAEAVLGPDRSELADRNRLPRGRHGANPHAVISAGLRPGPEFALAYQRGGRTAPERHYRPPHRSHRVVVPTPTPNRLQRRQQLLVRQCLQHPLQATKLGQLLDIGPGKSTVSAIAIACLLTGSRYGSRDESIVPCGDTYIHLIDLIYNILRCRCGRKRRRSGRGRWRRARPRRPARGPRAGRGGAPPRRQAAEGRRAGGMRAGAERAARPAGAGRAAAVDSRFRGNDSERHRHGPGRTGGLPSRHSRESGNPRRPARRRHRLGRAGGAREGEGPRPAGASDRPCAPPACRGRLYLAEGGQSSAARRGAGTAGRG